MKCVRNLKIILWVFSARNLFTRRSGGGLVQCEIGRFSNNIISVSRNRRFRTRYFITVRTIILDRYCCLHFLELFRFVFDRTADKSLRRSSNTYGCATTINCRRRYAARSLFFLNANVHLRSMFELKKKISQSCPRSSSVINYFTTHAKFFFRRLFVPSGILTTAQLGNSQYSILRLQFRINNEREFRVFVIVLRLCSRWT